MSRLSANGKFIELRGVRVSYRPKDDSIHLSSTDPDLESTGFHLTLAKRTGSEEALRELLTNHGLIHDGSATYPKSFRVPLGYNSSLVTHSRDFSEGPMPLISSADSHKLSSVMDSMVRSSKEWAKKSELRSLELVDLESSDLSAEELLGSLLKSINELDSRSHKLIFLSGIDGAMERGDSETLALLGSLFAFSRLSNVGLVVFSSIPKLFSEFIAAELLELGELSETSHRRLGGDFRAVLFRESHSTFYARIAPTGDLDDLLERLEDRDSKFTARLPGSVVILKSDPQWGYPFFKALTDSPQRENLPLVSVRLDDQTMALENFQKLLKELKGHFFAHSHTGYLLVEGYGSKAPREAESFYRNRFYGALIELHALAKRYGWSVLLGSSSEDLPRELRDSLTAEITVDKEEDSKLLDIRFLSEKDEHTPFYYQIEISEELALSTPERTTVAAEDTPLIGLMEQWWNLNHNGLAISSRGGAQSRSVARELAKTIEATDLGDCVWLFGEHEESPGSPEQILSTVANLYSEALNGWSERRKFIFVDGFREFRKVLLNSHLYKIVITMLNELAANSSSNGYQFLWSGDGKTIPPELENTIEGFIEISPEVHRGERSSFIYDLYRKPEELRGEGCPVKLFEHSSTNMVTLGVS